VIGLDPVVEMLELSEVPLRVAGVGEQIPLRDGSLDGVFSGFVFRNLGSVEETLDEIERVLRSGAVAVIVDLGRPVHPLARLVHRIGTAILLPLIGLLFAGAPREYWYLHRSLDSLPQPEVLYRGGSLTVEEIWRAGFLGFVYGVRLRKALAAIEEEPAA
jgi:ubiquinone/menaquinone biosynthesis C-methylase UbiE